jgi:acyl-CoA synthetase (AMP-forming)/AMP-acid ligase II
VLADDHGRSLTALELRLAAERVAAGLGVAPGAVVSWQLPTTIESIVVLAALARLGAVQNPVIPILREREVAQITEAVGTELYVTVQQWAGFPHATMAHDLGLQVVAVDLEHLSGGGLRLPQGDPGSLPPPPRSSTDCRWLYFSSGTTGDPKGARHSDASVVASTLGITDNLGFGATDVYPIAFPVAHIGGLTMTAAALLRGGCLVLFDTWDAAITPERAAAHRPTILGSAPPFLRGYLEAQRRHGREPLFPALRTCTAGGAPMPPELAHELVEAFGISRVVSSWGLTEFPIATCATPEDPPDDLATTVGRACPGVHIRVHDGELTLKGPQCFLGYVDADRYAEAFDEEGWFHTGDLGEIDARGNVRITGRRKDLIIRNAENISASEVEDVVRCHPAVQDVAVVGVPDPRTGERVCAFVVAHERHGIPTGEEGVTLADIVEHCHQHGMARHKWPEQLELVDTLPRSPMGKVQKQMLRESLH